MGEFYVSSAVFTPEGIEVTFMELPGDVRGSAGTVVRTRAFSIREDDERYGDDLRAIKAALSELVEEVADDWEDSEVFLPSGTDEPDDENEGMGSG